MGVGREQRKPYAHAICSPCWALARMVKERHLEVSIMLQDHHRAKIVTSEQLLALLGPDLERPTVVMCHGVFDVVHPGHVSHLLYAKSKAGLLVCSITADRWADKKGPYRPHVPQDIRAQNLAVMDVVDYVVICDAEKPLELIDRLRPDYFAKGFEYASGVRAKPIEEVAAVEVYGGEVLFTPGDVVYSSSALIEAAPPDLRWEKLRVCMERAGTTFDALRRIVEAMRGQHVHVVGDAIVDRLSYCEVVGANGKTPTVSVRRDRRFDFVGGAGVVAKHCRAAGAVVQLTTVVGDDKPGQLVLDDCGRAGVDVYPVVDRARPTTLKEAIVAGGYRMLKIDTVDNRSVSDALLGRLAEQVADTRLGAVVFSDFRHGIFNARTIPRLAAAIPDGMLRAADSQVASRWGNVSEFVGFDLLTPNEREARFALGDQDSGVRPLAARLREVARCRWLLMKMGARGVLGFGGAEAEAVALDSHASEIVDAVGAGDAFLAYATLALLVEPNLAAAAILGSFAAGAECEYDGNVPVAPERVVAQIDEAEGAV